jgi:predicted acetyltransferase
MNQPPAVEIRELTGEERVEAIYNLNSYAFHASPPFRDKDETTAMIRQRKGYRYFAALEGERAVAGAAGARMTQNLRGLILPGCAVWGVATLPQARRKGHCRRAMSALLAASHEDGSAVACLYPFRESFYNRMGFINLTQPKIASFSPQTLASLLNVDLGGEVELVLIGEGYQQFRQYLYDLQPRVHGMLLFDEGDPQRAAQNRQWMAKALVDGEFAGIMLYELSGDEITNFHFQARRFYYRDSQARYLLLSWIARHIDQVSRVEVTLPAWEQPETWYPDLDVDIKDMFIPPMGRVLDLACLEGLSVGEGEFSASLTDPLCPWNEGTWQFASRDGRLHVCPSQNASCELTIHALTALVYGINDPGDFSIRGWGNPQPEAQRAMRRMFSPQVVHLHEMF